MVAARLAIEDFAKTNADVRVDLLGLKLDRRGLVGGPLGRGACGEAEKRKGDSLPGGRHRCDLSERWRERAWAVVLVLILAKTGRG